jgi:zinc protease
MDPDRLRELLDSTLGQWKVASPILPKPTYPKPNKKPIRVLLVDRPGAVQTVVRFYLPADTAKTSNRIKLKGVGTILGGTFTSRLMQNLRENKGYTYGAYAGFMLQPSAGYLIAGADVRTDVTGASLREFLKELKGIRTGNITEDEVKKARNSMRTDLVQSASSLDSILSAAAGMYLIGRPYSDLGRDLAEISGLAPAPLNAIVRSAVPLENAVLVLVGDKTQILKQWQGLGLPTPVLVKPE